MTKSNKRSRKIRKTKQQRDIDRFRHWLDENAATIDIPDDEIVDSDWPCAEVPDDKLPF